MNREIILVLAAGAMLATACTPKPDQPPVPVQLEHLPVTLTTMGCDEQTKPYGPVYAWELPGTMPDDNSAPYGLRGRQLFAVPYCEPVSVVAHSWSEKERRYYVRIRLSDGSEGWVEADVVDIREEH